MTWLLCVISAVFFSFCHSLEVALDAWQVASSNSSSAKWYDTTIPSTVVAALVENGVYTKPYFGMNLNNIDTKQFESPWFFRNQFSIPGAKTDSTSVNLVFEGINYKANLWMNGQAIATTSTMVGTLVRFTYDVTAVVHYDAQPNQLLLQMYQPVNGWNSKSSGTTDLAISYIDWAPYAPDESMGILKPVYLTVLTATPALKLRHPLVNCSHVQMAAPGHNFSAPGSADLTVMIVVDNFGDAAVSDTMRVTIDGVGTISQAFTVAAQSKDNQILFRAADFPALQLRNTARLWWPYSYTERPYLYNITFAVESNEELTHHSRFGIREITAPLVKYTGGLRYRLFEVNGQPILITGGGYAPDLLQRYDYNYSRWEFEYVRHMGLNTIRLEGKWPPEWWFDLADEMGVMIMAGIECCDSWQHWSHWTDTTRAIAGQSIRAQLQRMRIHPSVFTFLSSSDEMPPTQVQEIYIKAVADTLWPNPVIGSAADDNSALTGETGVKMSGPYAWVPPNYWLESTANGDGSDVGGAFGFLTEGGPGASPLSYESLLRTVPTADVWPINADWDFHCGNTQGGFGSLKYFTPPLNARYGTSHSAQEYTFKAGVASYESHRAMFEAYARNKYTTATGVIQWMLNNAFPDHMWNLYDHYLNVNGAFFSTRKALWYKHGYHVMYSYDDNSIWLLSSPNSVNSGINMDDNVVVEARVRNLFDGGSVLLQQNMSVHSVVTGMGFDDSKKLFVLDLSRVKESVYSVQLLLKANNGDILDENVYWLASPMDVLNWKKSTWYNTPVTTYANFQSLSNLKSISNLQVNYTTTTVTHGNGDPFYLTQVMLSNPNSDTVAFMVQARIIESGSVNSVVAPVFFTDNFLTLYGTETRELNATYPVASLNGKQPAVVISMYNNMPSP